MIAVIYDPADGRIVQTVQGARPNIEADGRPFVEVSERRDDYDATHRVQDGAVVPIGGSA